MKSVGAALAFLALVVIGSAVLAQEEVPPPYAGMTNPFSWEDAAAQEAGEAAYKRMCLGCHGITGSGVGQADFSAADSAQELEERPDFHFWIVSEGRLERGMPPFKSSLTEEERWQVLTYIWSLGGEPAAPPEEATPAPLDPGGAIALTLPDEARAGEPFAVSAILLDSNFNALPGATVGFFAKVDFFVEDWAEIGRGITDGEGRASAEVTIPLPGDFEVAARYGEVESILKMHVVSAAEALYETEVGMELPHLSDDLAFGPQSAFSLDKDSSAPIPFFRVPGSMPGMLLLAYLGVVILVWAMYLRIMYQLLRIPLAVPRRRGTDPSLLPMVGLAVMGGLLLLLTFILITGPQSHFHLLH